MIRRHYAMIQRHYATIRCHYATILRHCGPRYCATAGHDTAPLRATIRRSARCLGVVRVASAHRLGSGCAPGAPNPVLTQCTVLSHCLGHCSRTLFMSTVHEVLKKIKSNKIKSNQIKSNLLRMKFSKIKFLLLKMI